MNKQLTFRKSSLLFALLLFVNFQLIAQNFSVSSLQGENLVSPTSLQFGPDGRLYVAQQDGLILAYTIQRNTSTNYQITSTETINNIKQIQNHNDDGTINNLQKRQVTGLLVTGTASNIVIYVGSSDSRIGGGGGGSDLNLDTNSGTISRLTKSGNSWQRLDLVRGLPRSEENHANNGMQLKGNLLYVAQGGNTNAGSPSNNFAFCSEYALSGAILTVDISAIDAMSTKTWTDGSQYKYDLPTVDDPTRANQGGKDIGDPFGGNDGLNQAKIVAGGPVQVYAGGFRNIYDLVWTQDNRLYTWDNGPNGGWGGHPDNEGFGTATNNWVAGEPGSNGAGPNDGQVNNQDGLHLVTSSGYYGGHPNPIRANPNGAGLFTHDANLGSGGNVGVWRTSTTGANPLPADWPPLPNSLANPIEGDYQNPGVSDQSLYTVNNSTNGLVEYTASNFDNAMKGDLLAASFKGPLYRVQRNNSGGINSNSSVTTLADNFSALPLDVTTQGDNGDFPGTIWVANLGSDNISVFEPQDFGGCGGGNNSQDEDGDQYTNNDELSNGTDPCNGASIPADFDKTLINGFLVSNLNDPDDDDDGQPDVTDPFVWDAQNGGTTNIPIDYPLLNADPGFGFFGLGFTGLMSNGSTDYLNLIQDEDNSDTEIIAGGAVGLLTFNNVAKGDPYTNNNTQQNGFQFGLNVNQSTQPFVYEGKLLGPIFNSTPQQYQSAGIYIGTGNQSDYLKVVINGNGPTTGIQILYEEADAVAGNQVLTINNIGFESEISLFMEITPSSGQVQVQYAVGNNTPQDIGQPVQLQGNVLNALQSNQALAIGIINTSISSTSTFNATYDYIKVDFIDNNPPPTDGTWVSIDNGTSCNSFGQSGSCAQGRHEAAYVQVGNKFYLLGGRENSSNVNIYDPATDIWTIGANAPYPVHHVQAVAYEGLIYMIGSFIDNNFPNENPNPKIVIYDPLADEWLEGPTIPSNRLRGSSGTVVYQNKIYIVNGLTNGHASGWVNWFDVFDPRTNQWTQLPNSPRTRDHFHAAVIGNKLYVAGGRRSGQQTTFTPTVGQVDVYNFQSNSWSTLPNNIPTQRAASTVGVLGNELIVIGGERNSGLANNQTEALDVNTNNWRTLTPMLQGRHGTQAIVNNGGIYVASGSPDRGGGSTRTQEAFFLNGQTNPTGNAISASNLNKSTNNLNFVSNNSSQNLTLTNSNGSQAIIIEGLSTNNNAFSASVSQGLPLHLSPGASVTVQVTFSSGNNASGQLTIQHTGNNAPSSTVNLTRSNNDPDNDGDGFPASQDCNDNDPNLTVVGASCNDGNANTVNDIVQSNCTCAGTPDGGGGTVTENCNGNTIEHGNGTIKLISGGNASFFKVLDENWQFIDNCGFNCGNSFTVNGLQAGKYRVFFEDSNYQPICDKLITLGSGGGNDPDNDGDGFPASQDCNDNDPNLTVVGASCNDGNANTVNDIVQSNCTCAGTPDGGGGTVTESCNGNTIEHGNGTIKLISGGNASFFKVLDENWQFIDNCGFNCGNSFTVNGLQAGKYRVFFEDSNYQPICDKLITLGSGGGNDPDNDGDGFPQSQDCNDNDPNLTVVGASCNDGNANTVNDIVQSNCTCAGTPDGGGGTVTENCNGNTIEHGNGTIKLISGGNASFFKVLDENWQFIDNCGFNCGNSFTVNGLQAGKYRVFFEDSNYQPLCDKLITLGGGNPPPSGNAIYINAGGPAVNVGGINWGADQYSSGGSTFTNGIAIANTTSDVIYQSERFAGGNVSYNVPVSNGTYEVQLHFAEIFFVGQFGGAGKRVFNINLEGQNVLNNYDINAVTGANVPTANVQTFTTTVSDGTLNINLNGIVENPKISAIAILPASGNRSRHSEFKAFATTGRKVKLNWVYPQINQPIHYEVEYAKGEDAYQLLETIKAEATLDVTAYGTLHAQPAAGENHYRIKVVFAGGGYYYIDPAIVDFESLAEFLTVFPNPTTGQLFIDLTPFQNQQVDLTMVNLNGQEVLEKRLDNDHAAVVELDISAFENGFYMLRAKVDGRRVVTQKVMMLRQY